MFQHKNIRFVAIVCLILLSTQLFSQASRNSGFSKPMNLPFNLAGSFGEPRKDHFHSGIDIKTNGIEGEPVFAIGDGYISRIRVSPYGYGKAIYITHTNGFTSVYGHLSKFYGKIEAYIYAQHYLLKNSELDLTLQANIFPVKQNDTIAFSGNTGGSDAPHLHFEIRNTKTEHALNPLDFYPKEFYVDTIPPQINKVKVFISKDIYENKAIIYSLNKNNNYLTTDNLVKLSDTGVVAFSLEGFDKQDNSENKNGIQCIKILQDEKQIFEYNLGEINFDINKTCNAFIDYNEMLNSNGYFYNCFRLKENKLTYYSQSNGIFHIKDSIQHFSFLVKDYNHNTVNIKIDVIVEIPDSVIDSAWEILENTISKEVKTDNLTVLINSDFKIIFPINCFYDDVYIHVVNLDNQYLVQHWNHTILPLHKPASIEFKSAIKKNRNKIVIIHQNHKGKETALKTTFDKTKFYAATKELGTFYLKYDTTKPVIKIINYELGIINENKSILAKISDNLSGISTYNVYIDDKWVNFYYDAKNDLLQYNIDENWSKGEHLLKIIVTDNVGNKSIVQQKFTY